VHSLADELRAIKIRTGETEGSAFSTSSSDGAPRRADVPGESKEKQFTFASDKSRRLLLRRWTAIEAGSSRRRAMFKVLAENPALAERRSAGDACGDKGILALSKRAMGSAPKSPLPEPRAIEDLRRAIAAIQLERPGISYGDAMALALHRNRH
jgi:hypothetical protein